MFRFEHPEYLFLLFSVPIIFGLYLLYILLRKNAWQKLADTHLLDRLQSDISPQKEWTKVVLLLLGFTFLSIAISNPQWGFKKQKVERKAADVFIAIDISNSMLARDIAPSRLERAKKFTTDLIESLKGDRIGLIVFAGSAYLQMPLSTDYAAAEFFVKSANPNNAPTQGTVISEAVKLALKTFKDGEVSHKALIVITDGENHEEEALGEMEKALDAGLVSSVVGVGTAEGDFIPMLVRGREDYKRDENGNPVRSIMNEPFMQQLAQAGGGNYYNIVNGDAAIAALKDRIDQLEKQDVEQRSFTDYESYFQYFLAIGIVLLILSEILSRKKGRIRKLIQKVRDIDE